MSSLSTPVVPYAPLEVTELLAPTALPSPRATDPPHLALPSYRLNLLAAHDGVLYLAAEDDAVFAYAICRANGLSVRPMAAFPVVPPTPVNNIRVARFPDRFGGPSLLLAGGDALVPAASGSISVLRLANLPTGSPDDQTAARIAETFYLNGLKSAWGLSADEASGRVAVSTNSHCAAVLSVAETGADAFVSQAVPPLAGTHFSNIPCVSFSHSGRLLGSASIDRTFAVFDVAPLRPSARRILQSRQCQPDDDAPDEWCWAFEWITPRTPRMLDPDDVAWPTLLKHRYSPSPTRLADALHEAPIAAAAAKAAALVARLRLLHGTSPPRKRRRTPSPLRPLPSPPTPPVYDDADGVGLPERDVRRRRRRAPLASTARPRVRGEAKASEGPRVRLSRIPCSRAAEPEDSLFVVGREHTLSLHRVVGGAGCVELDRVEPFGCEQGMRSRAARLSDIVEVPELSAVLVTQQHGAGVAVVRIVRRPASDGELPEFPVPHEAIRYLLVVETVIGAARAGWIAGSCVVRRDVAHRPPVFEVFVVREAGTVEAYEVGRKPCRVSASWAVLV